MESEKVDKSKFLQYTLTGALEDLILLAWIAIKCRR